VGVRGEWKEKEKNQQQTAAGQGQQEKENYFSVFLWSLSGLLLPQLISLARESLSFLFIFLADC
jgi:hypothetical protein